MKKTTLNLMLTLTCIAALTALTLAAVPADMMTAKIPFDFHIGNNTFPAGTYTISRASAPDAVIFRNNEHRKINGVTITHASSSRVLNEKAMLEFRRYGDQYFLARVLPAGSATNLALQKSRSERNAAEGAKNLAGKSVEPEIVTISGQ